MSNLIVTANDYQVLAARTAPKLGKMGDLNHAQLGLTTEVGEFADPIKRAMIYGKDLNEVNLREELGDIMWYVALAATAIGADLHTLMHENIEKLQKRFPGKFTQEAAIARADKEVVISFAHNLEDGWYVVQFPGGRVQEYNHWKDVKIDIEQGEFTMAWKGNMHYKPTEITKVLA
jgi:NTP pyrophosphatase (non-canonical NTP hydrolase)